MTESEIDGLKPGRPLDVMLESKIMGRKVKPVKEPCAWDDKGKAIMYGHEDYVLEDYDEASDGKPIPGSGFNPMLVFNYSNYDLGMVRVMDRMVGASGLHEFVLSWNTSAPGWVASIRWFDPEKNTIRTVHGHDEKFARLAVYRGALKVVLT